MRLTQFLDMRRQVVPISVQRKSRNVQRCNLARKNLSYDLMQHGFGVLSITLDLLFIFEQEPLTALQTKQILQHDLLEVFTGDLPWPVKNLSKETRECWDKIESATVESVKEVYPSLKDFSDCLIERSLSPVQFMIFKLADMLDLLFYCSEERLSGNQDPTMDEIFTNALNYSIEQIERIVLVFENWKDAKDRIINYLKTVEIPELCKAFQELNSLEEEREN